ncbi:MULTISPECIES: hypothetical protein [unclassified Moorena]|nr:MULTISPECIES: hypothetical protein [unclassified Moorena]
MCITTLVTFPLSPHSSPDSRFPIPDSRFPVRSAIAQKPLASNLI